MFGLRRMDVFSTGDLGIQRGMAAFAGKNVKTLKASGKGKWKYMNEKDMLELSEKFRPYRSVYTLPLGRKKGWADYRIVDTQRCFAGICGDAREQVGSTSSSIFCLCPRANCIDVDAMGDTKKAKSKAKSKAK